MSNPNLVNISDFGAIGDGNKDNTIAIQAALDFAKENGRQVYIPEGVFKHSGTLTADGITISGAGERSVLSATNPEYSALFLRGNAPSLSNVKFEVVDSVRFGTRESTAVCLDHAKNFEVRNITVDGAGSVGIFAYASSNGKIANNLVTDTRADGIHMTNDERGGVSHHIVVENNRIERAQDDSVAVVTYHDYENTNHDILIQNNTVIDQAFGRGYSVVGSHDVTIKSNYYDGGTAGNAGVAVIADGDYDTAGNWNIRIEGNTLKDAGGSNGGPGAIWIFNSQSANVVNRDVVIEGNQIYAPRMDGVMINGGGSSNRDISVINNDVYGPANLAVAQHDNAQNITIKDTNVLQLSSYPGDMVSPGGGVIPKAPDAPEPFSLPLSGDYQKVISGTSAADELTGSNKNDFFLGSRGSDIMSGENGDDRYTITGPGDKVIEKANGGIDTVYSYINLAKLSENVENLYLHGFDDLKGLGNGMNNRIMGNNANNILDGAAGKDILAGNGGVDRITGGAGNDIFVYSKISDAGDHITDFRHGEDLIDMRPLTRSLSLSGTEIAQAVKLVDQDGSTLIMIDADGAGGGQATLLVTLDQIRPTGLVIGHDLLVDW